MKRIALILTALCLPLFAVAADKVINPTVNLLTIKAIQTDESRGDELYIDVTAFHSKGDAQHKRFPQFPMYWPSESLDQIDNLELWAAGLAEGEAVEVIFSLVEHDVPPWNTDDLIGTVRLKMKNNGGQLESNWSRPNRVEGATSVITKRGPAQKFVLVEGDHHYDLYFMLNMKK